MGLRCSGFLKSQNHYPQNYEGKTRFQPDSLFPTPSEVHREYKERLPNKPALRVTHRALFPRGHGGLGPENNKTNQETASFLSRKQGPAQGVTKDSLRVAGQADHRRPQAGAGGPQTLPEEEAPQGTPLRTCQA